MHPADRANQEMIDRFIAAGVLESPTLIAAFRATPRHRFLDRVFVYLRRRRQWREVITRDAGPEELRIVYSDRALITHLGRPEAGGEQVPISSSSQPSLMALMLADLRPAPGQRVLEIGAGTGYNAALLAHVVGPGLVTTTDVDRSVLSEAWDHLRSFSERQVAVRHADGRLGLPDAGPFDRLMVTAATPDLEPAWLRQLTDGGQLVAPLALAPGLAFVVSGTVTQGTFEGRLTRAAYFMPLRAEGTSGAEAAACAPEAELDRVVAPWAGWFDRGRSRPDWFGFLQALALHAWLQGLAVFQGTLPSGEMTFGIGDTDVLCWLGREEWHVSSSAGRDLGRAVWRRFLDAGGPRPTAYTLRARPEGSLARTQQRAYVRQGPRCLQLWELTDPCEGR